MYCSLVFGKVCIYFIYIYKGNVNKTNVNGKITLTK